MASIKLKRGSGVPSGLTFGEPAYDFVNHRLYVGVTGGTVLVGGSGAIGGVLSFNGFTGAVTGVTTGTSNIFVPIQHFTAGLTSSGNITVQKITNTSSVIQANAGITGSISKSEIVSSASPGWTTKLTTLASNYTTNSTYPSEIADSGVLYCDAGNGLRIHSYNGNLQFWTGNTGSLKATLTTGGDFSVNSGNISASGNVSAGNTGILSAGAGVCAAGGTFGSRVNFVSGISSAGGSFSAKITVRGTSTAAASFSDGILNVDSTATNSLIFGTINVSPFAGYVQSGGSNIYPLSLNPLGGNVGIGTLNPGASLDVSGTLRVSQSSEFNSGISSAGATFTGLVRFSSGICASGGITLASPNLTGTPTTVTPVNQFDASTQIANTLWVSNYLSGALNTNLTFGADIAVNGGDITTTASTATLFNANATTLSIGGAATTTNIGAVASGLTFNIADTSIASGSKQVNIATQITGGATQRIAIGSGSGAIVSSTSGITIGSVTTSVINIPGTGTINASTTNATLNGATFGARVNFGAGICASGGVTLSGQLTGVSASFSGLIISTAGFSGTGITLSGNLSAATKSFLIPHPSKPEKKLQYACLEGPENGVYVRGRLIGTNVIELPDYWTALVHEDSITVQLTSFGEHKNYFVKSIQGNKVTIGPRSKDTDCFYLVQGERKDVPRLTVEY